MLVYDDNTGTYYDDEQQNGGGPPPPPSPQVPDNWQQLAQNEAMPPGGPAPPAGGGKTRQQIEQEGRDYDQAHGYIGGYMNGDVWVNGSPHLVGSPGPETGGSNFGNFQFGPTGWNFPTFTAPRFDFGQFQAPAPFEFQKFTAPTLEEAENEPGYKFARDQGIHALENNAFARGLGRSSGTLKDFIAFGNKFGEQNYGNAFNRSKDVFSTNEGNRFNAYQANFGNALSAYGTNRDTAASVFDRNYKGSWDEYSSKMDASKTDFSGALQKWIAQLNSLTQLSQPVA